MNVPHRLSTTRTMRHCVLRERPQRRAWMPPEHLEQSTSRQRSACSAADSNGSSVFLWHRTGSNMACVFYRTGMQIYGREKNNETMGHAFGWPSANQSDGKQERSEKQIRRRQHLRFRMPVAQTTKSRRHPKRTQRHLAITQTHGTTTFLRVH